MFIGTALIWHIEFWSTPSHQNKRTDTQCTGAENSRTRAFAEYVPLLPRVHLPEPELTPFPQIVNATLSQSVPHSVVTVVTGISKVFIGMLVERARDIQEQCADTESSPSIRPSNPPSFLDNSTQSGTQKRSVEPLQPDHLREALRRWKKGGEGGGAGFGGLSLDCIGVQGSKVAGLGGKRIFK